MDTNQAKVIELLRETHLLAFKEIERLNMRIAELQEAQQRPARPPVVLEPAAGTKLSPQVETRSADAILNEKQLADYLNVSVSGVRRWRTLRTGPVFLKIGRMVRYRRDDVEAWLKGLGEE